MCVDHRGLYLCEQHAHPRVHRPPEQSVPVCSGELRRWSHGDFTLLNDADAASAEYALDLLLPLGCSGQGHTDTHMKNCRYQTNVSVTCFSLADWQAQCGGFTSYVANEEDEEVRFS